MRLPHYLLFKYYFRFLRLIISLATWGFSLKRQPSILGMLLRNHIKRPEWLYYPAVELEPVKRLTVRPRREPDAGDLRLCERLIAAYHAACREAAPLETASALWKRVVNKRYQALSEALDAGNPRVLADLLAVMFQQDFLYGISSAQLGLDSAAATFIRITAVEHLLSLAESLALVRTEAPEQGVLGYGLSEGLPSMVQKIEKHFGIPVDFPDIGGAYGLQIGATLITPESPEHIYVAARINEAISRYLQGSYEPLRIVEIGAGFAGTAYWFNRLCKREVASYTIIDLPLMNVCQGYFLAKAFGPEQVQLHGETPSPAARFQVIPPHAKAQSISQKFQILINENSMPEMPESVVKDYLSWAKAGLTHLFYSYNQEAYSPVNGVPQTLVPKAVSEVTGYQRLSRNYSWLRRGYVEEIYSVK
jgi:hypothetical protein